MSDLQCPASFLLLTPETADGCESSELRLSLILTTLEQSHAIVQRLAAKDRCTIDTISLAEAAQLATKIAQLADHYRGEQVAVIVGAELLRAVLKQLDPPTRPVQLAVDSDGWTLREL